MFILIFDTVAFSGRMRPTFMLAILAFKLRILAFYFDIHFDFCFGDIFQNNLEEISKYLLPN